jgi:hypothetical protein
VIVRLILGIFDAALIVALYLLGIRAARILTLAEMAADDTDKALGWITEKAAPAIERVAALAPELADVLVTHRAVLETLPAAMHRDFQPPVVIEAEETPVPTQPDIPAQPKRRPRPGPAPDTVPTNRAITPEAITGGEREPDVEYARILADLEDQMHTWRKYRESLEWAKS